MHVITGGAYNGKWHFVKEFYHLTDEADFIKYSGYNNDKLPVDLLQIQTKYLIIQHLEMYVKKFFENDASVPSQTEAFVLNCLNWQERNPDSTLILIGDRKSTRLNSSHVAISYAVFCLKKKKK